MKPGTLKIRPVKGQLKENPKRFGKMSPFILFTLGGQHYRTEPSIEMDTRPVWNEEFFFNVVVPGEIKVEVFDLENDHETLMGRMEISTDDVCVDKPVEKVFHLKSKHLGITIGQVQIRFEWQPGAALFLPIPQLIRPQTVITPGAKPQVPELTYPPSHDALTNNATNIQMSNISTEKSSLLPHQYQSVSADPTTTLNTSSRSGHEHKSGHEMPIDPVRVPTMEERLQAMRDTEEMKEELNKKHHKPWKRFFHRHKK